jgi:membrane-associated phospholipid phosphatase
MMKRIVSCAGAIILFLTVTAQNDTLSVDNVPTMRDTLLDTISLNPAEISPTKKMIYKIRPAVDVPVTIAGSAWSLYAFTKIYSKPHSTDEEILGLTENNINGFDRWAVRPFSKSLDRISYYPFFASMPLPFLFLAGKKTNKDFFKLTFLYLEAMSITGFLYTGSVYFADRYRPYAYSQETPIDQRTRGGAKNSFYAGHVALVATSTFFMAQVYSDYHPDSKIKWIFYTLAATATGTTAYLRYRAGQHFPSDLLLGIAQGTLTGLLTPHLHKLKNSHLSIIPSSDGLTNSISIVYRF